MNLKTIEKLLDFAQLEPDWDSYGGCRIDKKALMKCSEFLNTYDLNINNIIALAPCCDGGIFIEMNKADKYMCIPITHDGKLDKIYFEKAGKGKDYNYSTKCFIQFLKEFKK